MTCATSDITIQKGETYSQVLRWESEPFVYKAITGITAAAPAVVTAVGHSVPDGWRVAVVSAGGMRQINAKNNPPLADEFVRATVLTVDTVELNAVNSADYTAYTSGGYLQYYTPVSLTGFTARMQVRATAESTGTALLDIDTDSEIVLDNTAKTITITLTAAVTAALTFTTGVYSLEMVSSGGVVTQLLTGNVTVLSEVTR